MCGILGSIDLDFFQDISLSSGDQTLWLGSSPSLFWSMFLLDFLYLIHATCKYKCVYIYIYHMYFPNSNQVNQLINDNTQQGATTNAVGH